VCIPAGTRNHFALDLGVSDRDPVPAPKQHPKESLTRSADPGGAGLTTPAEGPTPSPKNDRRPLKQRYPDMPPRYPQNSEVAARGVPRAREQGTVEGYDLSDPVSQKIDYEDTPARVPPKHQGDPKP
jgi:hypothetical protein